MTREDKQEVKRILAYLKRETKGIDPDVWKAISTLHWIMSQGEK